MWAIQSAFTAGEMIDVLSRQGLSETGRGDSVSGGVVVCKRVLYHAANQVSDVIGGRVKG